MGGAKTNLKKVPPPTLPEQPGLLNPQTRPTEQGVGPSLLNGLGACSYPGLEEWRTIG